VIEEKNELNSFDKVENFEFEDNNTGFELCLVDKSLGYSFVIMDLKMFHVEEGTHKDGNIDFDMVEFV
jgi:hypothetical protein